MNNTLVFPEHMCRWNRNLRSFENHNFLRVGSNGKYVFDEICVFRIFPTCISSSFGSNRNIYFASSEDFDPRRWGVRGGVGPALGGIASCWLSLVPRLYNVKS